MKKSRASRKMVQGLTGMWYGFHSEGTKIGERRQMETFLREMDQRVPPAK